MNKKTTPKKKCARTVKKLVKTNDQLVKANILQIDLKTGELK